MGGIKASVDHTIEDYHSYENLAMVIMPGGLSWEENDYIEIKEFVKQLIDRNIPVAAICGATYFLCKHGFLDHVKHTEIPWSISRCKKLQRGRPLYPAQVVVDGGIMTANETAAVEFAYEIFKILKVDSDEEMSQWYDNFKNGAVRQI